MNEKIISSGDFSMRLPAKSPFILAAHHRDRYPLGNDKMEPIYYIEGRNIGQDFDESQPWRMYHGDKIPGFPVHPHRGFETVTVMVEGFVDHTDSAGGTGRYGDGDVQWMTAGAGLQHCEMFPLVYEDRENPLEMFQIWLNLPAKSKMVPPHYKMLWAEDIPLIKQTDEQGKEITIRLIAGDYKNTKAPAPAPDSWAADSQNQVVIWMINLAPGARFTLRPTTSTAGRMVYYINGAGLEIENTPFKAKNYVEALPQAEITFKNGDSPSSILLLEGEPINEPMAAYGPFVMNSQQEIRKAYEDYQATQFGGWPWETGGPVNPKKAGRFAQFSDGSKDYPSNNKAMHKDK